MKTLEKCKRICAIIPFIVFMGIFYVYGIYYGVMNSFGYYSATGESFFTWDNYTRVINDVGFINSILFTLKISLIASLSALVIAILILYLIYINMKYRYFYPKILKKIFEAPLLVPYLIGAYAILITFMQRGILSNILVDAGILNSSKEFPILTNDRSGVGVIITYIWKSIPFILITCTPQIERIINKWEPLAKVYKLSDIKFYQKIILPIIYPSLLGSFFIILSYFLVSFETPYLLGVINPRSLAVYIFDLYTRGGLETRGIVMAMNVMMMMINLTLGFLVFKVIKMSFKYNEKGWE